MVAVPSWLLGKHATTITITGQDISGTGMLTNAAAGAKSLVGYLDEISINAENTTEMIQSMDVRRENEVIVGTRTTITFTEILKANDSSGTPLNILADAAMLFDYAKAIITRGGRTWTFYGLIKDYNEDIRRGKSTGRLQLVMVDPGIANPSYV